MNNDIEFKCMAFDEWSEKFIDVFGNDDLDLSEAESLQDILNTVFDDFQFAGVLFLIEYEKEDGIGAYIGTCTDISISSLDDYISEFGEFLISFAEEKDLLPRIKQVKVFNDINTKMDF